VGGYEANNILRGTPAPKLKIFEGRTGSETEIIFRREPAMTLKYFKGVTGSDAENISKAEQAPKHNYQNKTGAPLLSVYMGQGTASKQI
jgi:hypothetical protein